MKIDKNNQKKIKYNDENIVVEVKPTLPYNSTNTNKEKKQRGQRKQNELSIMYMYIKKQKFEIIAYLFQFYYNNFLNKESYKRFKPSVSCLLFI